VRPGGGLRAPARRSVAAAPNSLLRRAAILRSRRQRMDAQRFDEVTRKLASEASPPPDCHGRGRCGTQGLLLLVGAAPSSARNCVAAGKRCHRTRPCCGEGSCGPDGVCHPCVPIGEPLSGGAAPRPLASAVATTTPRSRQGVHRGETSAAPTDHCPAPRTRLLCVPSGGMHRGHLSRADQRRRTKPRPRGPRHPDPHGAHLILTSTWHERYLGAAFVARSAVIAQRASMR
jgi:hypothetical protein